MTDQGFDFGAAQRRLRDKSQEQRLDELISTTDDPLVRRQLQLDRQALEPLGFSEGFGRTQTGGEANFFDFVPFASAVRQAKEMEALEQSMDRLSRGIGDKDDQSLVQRFWDYQTRRKTFGFNVGQIAAGAIPFAFEFGITRGVGSKAASVLGAAGKVPRLQKASRALTEMGKPFSKYAAATRQMAARRPILGNVALALGVEGPKQLLGQTLIGETLGGSRVRAGMYSNYIANRYGLDPGSDYEVSVRVADDSYGMWTNALPASVVDNYIELFSESVGDALLHLPAAIKLSLLSDVGEAGVKAARKEIANNRMLSFLGLSPDPQYYKLWSDFGFQGLVPELGEEFVGAMTRDVVHQVAPQLSEGGNTEHLIKNLPAVALGMGLGMFGPAAFSSGLNRMDYFMASAKATPEMRRRVRALRKYADEEGLRVLGRDLFKVARVLEAGPTEEGSGAIATDQFIRSKWMDSQKVEMEALARINRRAEAERQPADVSMEAKQEEMQAMLTEAMGLALEERNDHGGRSPFLERMKEMGVITDAEAADVAKRYERRIAKLVAAMSNGTLAELADLAGDIEAKTYIAELQSRGIDVDRQVVAVAAGAWGRKERLKQTLMSAFEGNPEGDLYVNSQARAAIAALTISEPLSIEARKRVSKTRVPGAEQVVNQVQARRALLKQFADGMPGHTITEDTDALMGPFAGLVRRMGLQVIQFQGSPGAPVAQWDAESLVLFVDQSKVRAKAQALSLPEAELAGVVVLHEMVHIHRTRLGDKKGEAWIRRLDQVLTDAGFTQESVADKLSSTMYAKLSELQRLEESVAFRVQQFGRMLEQQPQEQQQNMPLYRKVFQWILDELHMWVAPRTYAMKQFIKQRDLLENAGIDISDMSDSQISMALMTAQHLGQILQITQRAEGAIFQTTKEIEKILYGVEEDVEVATEPAPRVSETVGEDAPENAAIEDVVEQIPDTQEQFDFIRDVPVEEQTEPLDDDGGVEDLIDQMRRAELVPLLETELGVPLQRADGKQPSVAQLRRAVKFRMGLLEITPANVKRLSAAVGADLTAVSPVQEEVAVEEQPAPTLDEMLREAEEVVAATEVVAPPAREPEPAPSPEGQLTPLQQELQDMQAELRYMNANAVTYSEDGVEMRYDSQEMVEVEESIEQIQAAIAAGETERRYPAYRYEHRGEKRAVEYQPQESDGWGRPQREQQKPAPEPAPTLEDRLREAEEIVAATEVVAQPAPAPAEPAPAAAVSLEQRLSEAAVVAAQIEPEAQQAATRPESPSRYSDSESPYGLALKIISGGQTGADTAGLLAARDLGLDTGGYIGADLRREQTDGLTGQQVFDDFGLTTIESTGVQGLKQRTTANAQAADGTVLFATNPKSPGSRQTLGKAAQKGKPQPIVNPTAEQLAQWILSNDIRILNVAGNRQSQRFTAEDNARVRQTIVAAVQIIGRRSDQPAPPRQEEPAAAGPQRKPYQGFEIVQPEKTEKGGVTHESIRAAAQQADGTLIFGDVNRRDAVVAASNKAQLNKPNALRNGTADTIARWIVTHDIRSLYVHGKLTGQQRRTVQEALALASKLRPTRNMQLQRQFEREAQLVATRDRDDMVNEELSPNITVTANFATTPTETPFTARYEGTDTGEDEEDTKDAEYFYSFEVVEGRVSGGRVSTGQVRILEPETNMPRFIAHPAKLVMQMESVTGGDGKTRDMARIVPGQRVLTYGRLRLTDQEDLREVTIVRDLGNGFVMVRPIAQAVGEFPVLANNLYDVESAIVLKGEQPLFDISGTKIPQTEPAGYVAPLQGAFTTETPEYFGVLSAGTLDIDQMYETELRGTQYLRWESWQSGEVLYQFDLDVPEVGLGLEDLVIAQGRSAHAALAVRVGKTPTGVKPGFSVKPRKGREGQTPGKEKTPQISPLTSQSQARVYDVLADFLGQEATALREFAFISGVKEGEEPGIVFNEKLAEKSLREAEQRERAAKQGVAGAADLTMQEEARLVVAESIEAIKHMAAPVEDVLVQVARTGSWDAVREALFVARRDLVEVESAFAVDFMDPRAAMLEQRISFLEMLQQSVDEVTEFDSQQAVTSLTQIATQAGVSTETISPELQTEVPYERGAQRVFESVSKRNLNAVMGRYMLQVMARSENLVQDAKRQRSILAQRGAMTGSVTERRMSPWWQRFYVLTGARDTAVLNTLATAAVYTPRMQDEYDVPESRRVGGTRTLKSSPLVRALAYSSTTGGGPIENNRVQRLAVPMLSSDRTEDLLDELFGQTMMVPLSRREMKMVRALLRGDYESLAAAFDPKTNKAAHDEVMAWRYKYRLAMTEVGQAPIREADRQSGTPEATSRQRIAINELRNLSYFRGAAGARVFAAFDAILAVDIAIAQANFSGAAVNDALRVQPRDAATTTGRAAEQATALAPERNDPQQRQEQELAQLQSDLEQAQKTLQEQRDRVQRLQAEVGDISLQQQQVADQLNLIGPQTPDVVTPLEAEDVRLLRKERLARLSLTRVQTLVAEAEADITRVQSKIASLGAAPQSSEQEDAARKQGFADSRTRADAELALSQQSLRQAEREYEKLLEAPALMGRNKNEALKEQEERVESLRSDVRRLQTRIQVLTGLMTVERPGTAAAPERSQVTRPVERARRTDLRSGPMGMSPALAGMTQATALELVELLNREITELSDVRQLMLDGKFGAARDLMRKLHEQSPDLKIAAASNVRLTESGAALPEFLDKAARGQPLVEAKQARRLAPQAYDTATFSAGRATIVAAFNPMTIYAAGVRNADDIMSRYVEMREAMLEQRKHETEAVHSAVMQAIEEAGTGVEAVKSAVTKVVDQHVSAIKARNAAIKEHNRKLPLFVTVKGPDGKPEKVPNPALISRYDNRTDKELQEYRDNLRNALLGRVVDELSRSIPARNLSAAVFKALQDRGYVSIAMNSVRDRIVFTSERDASRRLVVEMRMVNRDMGDDVRLMPVSQYRLSTEGIDDADTETKSKLLRYALHHIREVHRIDDAQPEAQLKGAWQIELGDSLRNAEIYGDLVYEDRFDDLGSGEVLVADNIKKKFKALPSSKKDKADLRMFMSDPFYDEVEGLRSADPRQGRGPMGFEIPNTWDVDNMPGGADTEWSETAFLLAYDEWLRQLNVDSYDANLAMADFHKAIEKFVDEEAGDYAKLSIKDKLGRGIRGDKWQRFDEINRALLVAIDVAGWLTEGGEKYAKKLGYLPQTASGPRSFDQWVAFVESLKAKQDRRLAEGGKLAEGEVRLQAIDAETRATLELAKKIIEGKGRFKQLGFQAPHGDFEGGLAYAISMRAAFTTELARRGQLIRTTQEWYISLLWEDTGERPTFEDANYGVQEPTTAGGPATTGVGYRAKRRSILGFVHGTMMGKKLTRPGAVESWHRTTRKINESLMNRAYIEGLKAIGAIEKAPKGGVPKGYKRVDVKSVQGLSGYMAKEWIANYLKNSLTQYGVKDIENPVYRNYMRLTIAAKHIMLMFGFFHHQAFLRSYLFTVNKSAVAPGGAKQLAKELMYIAGASALSYGRAFGVVSQERIEKLAMKFTPYRVGAQAIENRIPALELGQQEGLTIQKGNEVIGGGMAGAAYDPEDKEAADAWVRKAFERIAGWAMSDEQKERAYRFVEAFRRGQLETASWLFNSMGANLKAAAYLDYYDELVKDNFERLKTDTDGSFRRALARKAALKTNADFGGLNLKAREGKASDFMGAGGPRNPRVQMALRAMILAPDWTESNLVTVLNVLKAQNVLGQPDELKRIEKNMYRHMWLRVGSRALAIQFVINSLLAGLDPDRDLFDMYREAGFFGQEGDKNIPKWSKFRWLDINASLLSPTESRKFISVFGHFGDPLKWTADFFNDSPIAPLDRKGSVAMRMIVETITGADYSGRRFTTWREIMGIDYDAGVYQRKTTLSDGTIKLPGESKAGKYAGKLSRFSTKTGAVSLEQVLGGGYLWTQLFKFMPLQGRALIEFVTGQKDAFDFAMEFTGTKYGRTYPK